MTTIEVMEKLQKKKKNLGVCEFGSLEVREFGSSGVWEFGSS
jgi:hypothetical protein